ncbi:MAG TPA: hypothetical protein VLI72_01300, partial [Methylibium sp.]|nr:hypothetical protein [Methylibium sp.]
MSYILDALRKADAQRSRGAVPDLSAQPLDAPAGTDAPAARGVRLGLLAGLVVLAAALGTGAWWWFAAARPGPPA